MVFRKMDCNVQSCFFTSIKMGGLVVDSHNTGFQNRSHIMLAHLTQREKRHLSKIMEFNVFSALIIFPLVVLGVILLGLLGAMVGSLLTLIIMSMVFGRKMDDLGIIDFPIERIVRDRSDRVAAEKVSQNMAVVISGTLSALAWCFFTGMTLIMILPPQAMILGLAPYLVFGFILAAICAPSQATPPGLAESLFNGGWVFILTCTLFILT